jgi:flavin-dependent dehydrogenase
MENYDVLVVGAGLAGLQCARLLGSQGFRVLLIDHKKSLSEKIHTTGIFVRRTLEDFDLPEQHLGPVVNHVKLYSPKRKSMILISPYDEFRVGRMADLYQHYLNECLGVGVTWLSRTRYISSMSDGASSIVRLERERCEDTVKAQFIVGADGATSRVAHDLGLDQNREWIVGVEDVFRNNGSCQTPMFHCFLDPIIAPGYLAWIINDGEDMHIGVGGYPSYFDPVPSLEKFKSSIRDIIDFNDEGVKERRGGRIPVGGILENIINDRGLLVGDAAGAVSPLTAGGLDPCMRLSYIASEVITKFLKSGNVNDLKLYSGKLFRPRFASRLFMRRVFSNLKQPFVVELGCSLLRLPVFRSLAWHVFFGRSSFPDIETKSSLKARSLLKA